MTSQQIILIFGTALFNYTTFTNSYIKSDMHAISIDFSSFEIMYNLQLDLNDERNQSKWVKEIQYYKRCSILYKGAVFAIKP